MLGLPYKTDHDLTNAADKGFNTADLDKLETLNMIKIMRWVEINEELMAFVKEFSPSTGNLSTSGLFAPIMKINYEAIAD